MQDIRALRKRLGLSQREFAKRLGVSTRSVKRWERGQSKPQGEAEEKLTFLLRRTEASPMPLSGVQGDTSEKGDTFQKCVTSQMCGDTFEGDTFQKGDTSEGDTSKGDTSVDTKPGANPEVTDQNVTDENVTDQNVTDENGSNDRVEVTSDRPDSREACASDGTAFDPAYITNVLELLHGKSDGIVEVRIFPNDRYLNINGHREWVGKTVSGYYTDVTKIAQDVKPFDGKGNIYFTLNPVNPDLLARAANRLKYSVETTTKDNDIIADRWLPIDIDPIRPKDISSTDKELKLALKKQAEIVTWLDKFSIPTITGMSGNGAHILIPLIGYPNNQETRQAKEQFIKFFCLKFSYVQVNDDGTKEGVNVDVTVFNMARIWKLYGTLAVKGDNIPSRPHRRAWLSIPEQMPEPIDLYAMLPDILPKKESEPACDAGDDAFYQQEKERQERERPKSQASISDQELIEKAKNAKNGAKFTALWSGDTSFYASQSEADLALCCLLAFWTGGDYERIDRLFRQSGLYREKWERDDYREQTIHKAYENTTEFYESTNSGQVLGDPKPFYSNAKEEGKRAKHKEEDLKAQIAKIRRRKKAKAFEIKQAVSEVIIDDMLKKGKFYQTRERFCYFFDEEQKELYLIGDDKVLGAQIEDLYGINTSEQEYDFLIARMETEALIRGELTEVHQFAFYSTLANILYVYNNDNGIHRLDGQEIQLVDNGFESVLFFSDPLCEPFEYVDIGDQKFLDPLIIDPINFGSGDGVNLNKEEQQWLFWIDIHTKFFEALLPTKPIVAFIGPTESGKSMAQRLLLKVLFGSGFNVTSMSKEDDFDAAVTYNYIVAFDNVDGKIDWLNDKLAHTATGKMMQKRKLYTTNENVRYFPKCFLMLNARSPRFKREDVTNRLLLFRTEGIDKKRSEGEMIDEVMDKRNEIWSELLNVLNIIVRELATETKDFTTAFRMADWAKLGWQIAKKLRKASWSASHAGYEKTFLHLLSKMGTAQSEFLLEDDPIFLCLDAWLAKPANVGREVTSSTLYNDFQIIAQTESISFTYKSTKSFGRRLQNLLDDLREFFDIRAEKRKNKWTYVFQPKG